MTVSELRELHQHSSYHRDSLASSNRAGCFHCKAVFPATQIWEWIDDSQTAPCPRCGIDSVLPDSVVNVTPELLAEMKRYWFNRDVPLAP